MRKNPRSFHLDAACHLRSRHAASRWNERGFFCVHSELILALKKVPSYRKLGRENLLSIVYDLFDSIRSDHGATQPSHIYLTKLPRSFGTSQYIVHDHPQVMAASWKLNVKRTHHK